MRIRAFSCYSHGEFDPGAEPLYLMSLSKRILFDNDPAHDEIRGKMAEETWTYCRRFTFRIPARRRNVCGGTRHWDPLWPSSVNNAAKELNIEHVQINEGIFFLTSEDRDAVRVRAEAIWRERLDGVVASITSDKWPKTSKNTNRSAQPTILAPIPPDPQPTEVEIEEQLKRLGTGDREFLRNLARLSWAAMQKKIRPDDFLVPFPPDSHQYLVYRTSSLWKGIRKKVLKAANYKCAGCANKAVEVHHRDYRPRILNGTDLSPLVALCNTCHQNVHYVAPGKARASWQDSERVLAEIVAREAARVVAAAESGE